MAGKVGGTYRVLQGGFMGSRGSCLKGA